MGLIFLIISFLICIGYGIFAKVKYPELTCISETYYKKLPFMYWCWICGFTLVPTWLELSPENFQFLAFLSCCSFIFLGTVPRYLTDQMVQHYTCVSMLISLAIIWMICSDMWYIAAIVLPIMWLCNYSSLWLAEIAGFLILYITLFISYFK